MTDEKNPRGWFVVFAITIAACGRPTLPAVSPAISQTSFRATPITPPRQQVWDGSYPRCWEWDPLRPNFFWETHPAVCHTRFGPWTSAWVGDQFVGYTGDSM